MLFTSDSFEDSIRKVISYGGDTDTNCAIVAGIANKLDATPQHKHHIDDIKQLQSQLDSKYDKNENVMLACSMPSIEYWFLLHYENTNKYLRTSGDAIKALKKYIPQFDKKIHFLEQAKWVEDLIKENKMNKAMQRAEKFGRNGSSYTDVWKAIKKINDNK